MQERYRLSARNRAEARHKRHNLTLGAPRISRYLPAAMKRLEAHSISNEPDNANTQLLVQLLKLSSLISGPMQDGVATANDVGLNELKILMCLGGEGALAGHDISEIMAISPMNVSRALSALLERGWIEPAVDPGNRRRKPVQLSAVGWKAHRAMTPDVGAVANYLLGTLTATEKQTMARASAKVVSRMADWFEQHHADTHLRHP
jgi:DNA-binding MarR family transcriptional regulator